MDHAHLLHEAADRTMATLKLAGQSLAAQTWLKPAFEKAEGVEEVLGLLESQVETGIMLEKIVAAKHAMAQQSGPADGKRKVIAGKEATAQQTDSACEIKQQRGNGCVSQDLATMAGFTEVHHQEAQGAPREEALDQYVVVNKGDVLDAIGSFVAAYLVTIPEAQNLQPSELQNALRKTFRELRKSRMRIAWEWGHYAYRAAAMGYGVFSVYENPWLFRALLTAVWAASRSFLGQSSDPKQGNFQA